MAPFDSITAFGFTAVPASTSALFNSDTYPAPSSPAPFIPVSETPVPNTALAKRVDAYVRANLPAPTYNHSLRVYHYGLAIKRYRFPSWNFTDETYFLSCLLHDIATTDENLHSTRLSFEFYGGVIALGLLQEPSAHADAVAPKEQAESVAEAVIRHQDLCNVGTITAVGQLLQLATIFGPSVNHEPLGWRC